MCFECQSECSIALNKFSGKKSLTNFITSKKAFVEPVEIVLGGGAQEKEKLDTYQYVPILQSLDVILRHEDVLGEVFSPRADDNVLREFSDGLLFQNNPLFKDPDKSLELIIYHDDFNVVNPLIR